MENGANVTDFGFGGIWGIIMLLIVAGLFGNGFGFGGNNSAVTQEYVANQFTQRDIFNTNTSVLENRYANALSSATTDKEVLTNRYENALGVASLQKDILLSAQNTNASMSSCCCEIKNAIRDDGEKTRALITANYQASLLEKINDLKAQVSNNEQTGYLLQTMGRWHAYPSCGCGYGTCNTNLI